MPGSSPGEGMLFRPAGSIHMLFMRFAIDAIFCDGDLVVIDVARGLRPWRMASRKGAKVVIEVAEGAAEASRPATASCSVRSTRECRPDEKPARRARFRTRRRST